MQGGSELMGLKPMGLKPVGLHGAAQNAACAEACRPLPMFDGFIIKNHQPNRTDIARPVCENMCSIPESACAPRASSKESPNFTR